MKLTPFCPDGLAVRLALLGGVGRAPLAPGTVATFLAGVPCGYLLGFLELPLALAATAAVVVASCYVAGFAEKALGRHDCGEIVIDELAGYLVTVVGLPVSVWNLLAGAVLFRIFDIWKPWPIRQIQILPGGQGIVADDVVAGFYALVLTQLLMPVLLQMQ